MPVFTSGRGQAPDWCEMQYFDTGMGHHHDMPQVYAPVRAVYFETTMQGQKRRGHLWDHTHGPAQAQTERV